MKFFPAAQFQNATLQCLTEIGSLSLKDRPAYNPQFIQLFVSVITQVDSLLTAETGPFHHHIMKKKKKSAVKKHTRTHSTEKQITCKGTATPHSANKRNKKLKKQKMNTHKKHRTKPIKTKHKLSFHQISPRFTHRGTPPPPSSWSTSPSSSAASSRPTWNSWRTAT